MYALTLWPEWLPCFTCMGKDVENRTWRPPDRLIGQRFALHAGKNVGGGSVARNMYWLADAALTAGWTVEYRPGDPPALWYRPTVITGANQAGRTTPIVTGAIVATAVLADAVQDHPSIWAMDGQWHWVLEDVRLLPTPIPAKGRQGLWHCEIPAEAGPLFSQGAI